MEHTQEVLPCPFCGSAQIEHESMQNVRYLRCQKCSCTGGHVFSHEAQIDFTRKSVIQRWNLRSDKSVPQQSEWIDFNELSNFLINQSGNDIRFVFGDIAEDSTEIYLACTALNYHYGMATIRSNQFPTQVLHADDRFVVKDTDELKQILTSIICGERVSRVIGNIQASLPQRRTEASPIPRDCE